MSALFGLNIIFVLLTVTADSEFDPPALQQAVPEAALK